MLQTLKNWLHKRRAPPPNTAPEKASTYALNSPEHLHLHWHVSDITQIPAQLIWHSPGSVEFNALESTPQPTSQSPAYDPHLLDNARTQWQFGDWDSLVKLQRDSLEHHPERAKLALLAAAGHQQVGDMNAARGFVQLARDWGCDKQLISRVLVAGVYNTLGRATLALGDRQRALGHYKTAATVVNQKANASLLADAQMMRETLRLDVARQVAKQIQPPETPAFVDHARYNREQRRLCPSYSPKLNNPEANVNAHDGIPQIRKVVVTGDFLRPSLEGGLSQETNIRWLFSLFEPQLRAVLDPHLEDDSTVRCFFGDLDLAHSVYTSLNIPFTESSWAAIFNNDLSLIAKNIIKNLVGEDNTTLIIGFEMSPSILDYLTSTRIPYINTRISPYRYLDDLLLSFSSNVPEISRRLFDFDTPKPSFYLAASIEKHKRRFAALSITQDALVFFGQTPGDAALIQSDTFISFNNYKESIISAANSVKTKYYKPHPYLRDENAILFFQDLGFELIDDNAYDLLSSNALVAVMGLNSSVLYEAVYFKKKVFRLHPTDLYANNVHIYDSFLDVAFWSKILGKDLPTGSSRLAGRPNLVRESLGVWWAK